MNTYILPRITQFSAANNTTSIEASCLFKKSLKQMHINDLMIDYLLRHVFCVLWCSISWLGLVSGGITNWSGYLLGKVSFAEQVLSVFILP